MITDGDFKVDYADDIIIDSNDAVFELDNFTSAMRNAQRRISAGQSDFKLRPEIAAGIESFLQRQINILTLSDIELTIKSCMVNDGLFSGDEFAIKFDTSDTTKLGVLISLKKNGTVPLDSSTTFSVYVDKQNMRSYA
jgi:hypothetical protein